MRSLILRYLLPLAILIAWLPLAQAQMIIPIAGTGPSPDSQFQKMSEFFDAQPATEPVAGTTLDDFGDAPTVYTIDGRAFYIDFGPDFASVSINRVWLGLKNTGTGPTAVDATFFWSSENTKTFDGDDVLAPDFNLFSFTPETGSKSWLQIYSNETGITPRARYFIVSFNNSGGSMGNRVQEMVFVSNVPEPSTGVLGLATGALLLARRQRRN